MKIRAGFVSNSSTSSYIIYAVKTKNFDSDIGDYRDAVYSENSEAYYVGKILASLNDGGEIEVPIELTDKIKEETQMILKKYSITDIPKLYLITVIG